MDLDKLIRDFTYHPPKGDQVERYGAIRAAALDLGKLILDTCPASAERDDAIRKLSETVMWANASIARNE